MRPQSFYLGSPLSMILVRRSLPANFLANFPAHFLAHSSQLATSIVGKPSRRWLLGLLSIWCAAGCDRPEGIRAYTVKKAPPASRMLAAIVPQGDQAWFFKMAGPNLLVAAQAESFTTFVKSVQLDDGPAAEPKWILPAGWTRQPGDAMRFATLEVAVDSEKAGDSEKLECTVSKLPRLESPLDEYLLANINRWRGQLRLPPLTVGELPKETTMVSLATGKLQATLVNFQGDLKAGGMGPSPPFAGGNGVPKSRSSPNSDPNSRGAGPTATATPSALAFKAPTGWSQGELEIARGGIVVRRDAAFEVKDGDKRVEITVTKLPSAAGATLPNVNRWRGQIGLENLSPEEFEKEKKKIDVAGVPSDYVQFSGSQQAILGVIAERDGLAWFIKLQGDQALAGRERQNFEGFVQSIRFE